MDVYVDTFETLITFISELKQRPRQKSGMAMDKV